MSSISLRSSEVPTCLWPCHVCKGPQAFELHQPSPPTFQAAFALPGFPDCSAVTGIRHANGVWPNQCTHLKAKLEQWERHPKLMPLAIWEAVESLQPASNALSKAFAHGFSQVTAVQPMISGLAHDLKAWQRIF